MSLTININVAEQKPVERTEARTLFGSLTKPVELDFQADGVTPMIPLQGPPISMLLFALTRATTDPTTNQLMTSVQKDSLDANRRLYEIFRGSGAGATALGKNGIDVFTQFITANSAKTVTYLETLQAAQALFRDFKAYVNSQSIWDDTCDLKYSQLANVAQIDWKTYE